MIPIHSSYGKVTGRKQPPVTYKLSYFFMKHGLPERKPVDYKQTSVVKNVYLGWSGAEATSLVSHAVLRIWGRFPLFNKIQLWSPRGPQLWAHGLVILRITWEAFWTCSFLSPSPRDSVTADLGVGPGNLFLISYPRDCMEAHFRNDCFRDYMIGR